MTDNFLPLYLLLPILILGLLIGVGGSTYKFSNHANFFISICVSNNNAQDYDTQVVEQCKQSFNIFKAK